MADSAERSVEETAQVMEGIRKARMLTKHELANVTRRRRNYEYQLVAPKPTVTSYLEYAAFERDLAELLKKRAKRKGVKKDQAKLFIHRTSSRVGLVYSRAVRRFKGDVDLWLHYARYLIGSGTHRAAGNVLGRALALRPDSEKIWLAIIALHADTMGDPGGARKLAMRALRNLPQSSQLWITYYRVELAFLCKAIARRVAMKLPVPDGEGREHLATEQSAKHENTDEDNDASKDKENSPDEKPVNTFADIITNDDQKDEAEAEELNDNDACEAIDIDAGESDENKESEVMAGSDSDGNNNETGNVKDVETGAKTPAPNAFPALKFWHGGIPLTVFRRANNQLNLTNEQLTEYWKVAVNMPFSPWQLVKQIHDDVSSDVVLWKVIAARLEFDISMSKREHIPADSNQFEAATEAAKTSTETACTKICELLEDVNIRTSDSVEQIVHSFGKRAGKLLDSKQQERLINGLKALQERAAAIIDEDDGENMSLEELCKTNNLEAWKTFLKKSRDTEGPEKNQIRLELRSKILVPLRNAEKDQIAVAWVRWESNDDNREVLVELIKAFLEIPPVSFVLLREFISVLKRLDGPWELRRRLYDMICSRKEADVDMWIEYTEFERDVVKDNAKSKAVVWKAKKALSEVKAQLFEEKLCVRLLAL